MIVLVAGFMLLAILLMFYGIKQQVHSYLAPHLVIQILGIILLIIAGIIFILVIIGAATFAFTFAGISMGGAGNNGTAASSLDHMFAGMTMPPQVNNPALLFSKLLTDFEMVMKIF